MARRTKTQLMESAPADVVKSRFVDHNTLEHELTDGSVAWQLHDTIIVKRYPMRNGEATLIRLNSGGWRGITTKDRINKALRRFDDARTVWSEHGIWYLGNAYTPNRVPFYDQMIFPIGGPLPDKGRSEESRIKHQQKQIERYCRKLRKRLQAGENNRPPLRPELGDCLYCQGRVDTLTQDGVQPGCDSTDHLQSHLDEVYIMGTLTLRACIDRGCGPLIVHAVAQGDGRLQSQFSTTIVGAVRRYFRRKLGIGY